MFGFYELFGNHLKCAELLIKEKKFLEAVSYLETADDRRLTEKYFADTEFAYVVNNIYYTFNRPMNRVHKKILNYARQYLKWKYIPQYDREVDGWASGYSQQKAFKLVERQCIDSNNLVELAYFYERQKYYGDSALLSYRMGNLEVVYGLVEKAFEQNRSFFGLPRDKHDLMKLAETVIDSYKELPDRRYFDLLILSFTYLGRFQEAIDHLVLVGRWKEAAICHEQIGNIEKAEEFFNKAGDKFELAQFLIRTDRVYEAISLLVASNKLADGIKYAERLNKKEAVAVIAEANADFETAAWRYGELGNVEKTVACAIKAGRFEALSCLNNKCIGLLGQFDYGDYAQKVIEFCFDRGLVLDAKQLAIKANNEAYIEIINFIETMSAKYFSNLSNRFPTIDELFQQIDRTNPTNWGGGDYSTKNNLQSMAVLLYRKDAHIDTDEIGTRLFVKGRFMLHTKLNKLHPLARKVLLRR